MKLLHAGVIAILVCAGVSSVSCSREGASTSQSSTKALYYCPMHPAQTSDKPGDCPICQMRLVLHERTPAAQGTPTVPGQGSRTAAGMEKAPVEGDSTSAGLPADWSEVQIPIERLQRSGVTLGQVAAKRSVRTIRAIGRVVFDETRVHHIHTKFSGWIEHLYVDSVGKLVHRGEPLFTVYSPELLATQEEFLHAMKAKDSLQPGSDPDFARGVEEMVEAARRRLQLWDISDAEIDDLEKTRRVRRTLTIYSPTTGVVVEKNTSHGMYVEPSLRQASLADLSKVWILADVYENELSQVREGQKARVRLSYFPGEVRQGRVSYVYPTLDPETRTAKVRIEMANPRFELRPDMLADVDLEIDAGIRVVIPKQAVIRAGRRAIAFLDRGEGRLVPREIEIGLAFDDDLEVLSGLSPGDRVVTSANFLIDSESRLRAALESAATAADSAHPAKHGAPADEPPGGRP